MTLPNFMKSHYGDEKWSKDNELNETMTIASTPEDPIATEFKK